MQSASFRLPLPAHMVSLRDLFTPHLSQHARLLSIDTALPDAALVVERFSGREAVNTLFRLEIDCLAGNAHFELKRLLGEEVTLRLLLADGTHRHWHGYVTSAMSLGADGGLARYRIIVEPWLAFTAQRQNCLQFQDVDVLGVLDTVFGAYDVAHWRSEITQPLRNYSRITQFRETEFSFITRLLAEEGLSYRFEHDQSSVAGDEITHSRHTLVLFDRAAEAPECAQPQLRFHRADAPEVDDTVQVFSEHRHVQPNAVSRSGWDYKTLKATGAQLASTFDNGDVPLMEVFDGSRAYVFEDAAAAELRADLTLAGFESAMQCFDGAGSVRVLGEGHAFTLTQHESYRGEGARFRTLHVEHHGANNLGAQASQLLEASDIEAGSYRNRFSVQRLAAPLVPRSRARPRTSMQSARVVGLPDAVVSTDRDHRIKIQYHWQRGDTPNPGGLDDTGPGNSTGNAPGNQQSGTWVRVAEWLAGPNWGSHFVPRVGSEVLVDFINGDIDRPLVIGQLYNGEDLPPFSAGVDSGANHPGVLSGWFSHNHQQGAGQHCEWVVDDAPGQLRTRLSTSYETSELGLGHLIEQRGATRGAWRGTGFELRTDGWLAVRAGEGMLISTTARHNATGTQMEIPEAVAQLRAAEQTAKTLSDAAAAQGAHALSSNRAQREFIDAIDAQKDGKYDGSVGGQEARKAQPGTRALGDAAERFAKPIMLSESPDSIGLATPASGVLYAGRHLHATTQSDLHAAAAHTLSTTAGEAASWFSHSGGIKSIAAAGSHTVQAHTDAMEILADDSVTITSSNDEIHVLAKGSIVLRAAQSSVTIEGGDITFACPGTFSVKGASHAFEGPGSAPAELPAMPVERADEAANWIAIRHADADNIPFADQGYKIHFEGGSVISGKLDRAGTAHHENVPQVARYVEYEPRQPEKESPWESLAQMVSAARQRLG